MDIKNKYMKCSHISESKFREILKYFCLDLTGSKICELTSLNKNTVSRILLLIRSRILQISKKENDLFNGQIEVDESDFGAKRVKGKRGRGALGKTIVFGLLKRGGKVYTEIVPDSSSATLQDVIRGKVDIDTVIHSDGWRGDIIKSCGWGKKRANPSVK